MKPVLEKIKHPKISLKLNQICIGIQSKYLVDVDILYNILDVTQENYNEIVHIS